MTNELPQPEVHEWDGEFGRLMWNMACEMADDCGDWAVAHPLVNTRAELPRMQSSTGVCRTDVGQGLTGS